MIIVSKHYNQLCNRLFSYLPALSYAIEADEKVVFIFQYKGYDKLFPNLRKKGVKSFYPVSSWKQLFPVRIFNALVKISGLTMKRRNNAVPLKKPLGILFSPGWKAADDEAYIEKHKTELKEFFMPCPRVAEIIDARISSIKTNANVSIVGVHIRRGDYKYYKGGKYFFDDSTYLYQMNQMKDLLMKNGKQPFFLITTNEQIELENFKSMNAEWKKDCSLIEDLYTLAACDYIIGAPSTFSQWASFYGDVPLSHIKSSKSQILENSFFKVAHLNKFIPIEENMIFK